MFIRSGFIVVIIGVTLTSLSTVIVALRYVDQRSMSNKVPTNSLIDTSVVTSVWVPSALLITSCWSPL
jgi:hypothetical protein